MFSFSHTWKNKSMIKHFFSWQNKIAGGKQITSRRKIHIVVDLWKKNQTPSDSTEQSRGFLRRSPDVTTEGRHKKKLFKFSAADSVSFARDRETLSEAESEPIDSSLSFGDGNMETSSAAARHADVTPQSRTTTSLRTTTPTEPTPPGLRGSSEEGERLWGNCLTLFLFSSVNITYKQRYNTHESRNMIFYYLNKNRTTSD